MRETGGHLDHRVENQVDHQGNAAPVAVGQQSKDESAHRPERQRQRDGERNLLVGAVKLLRNGRQREDNQKEVESIQRPAEKAGNRAAPWPSVGVAIASLFATVESIQLQVTSSTPANTIQRIPQRQRCVPCGLSERHSKTRLHDFSVT